MPKLLICLFTIAGLFTATAQEKTTSNPFSDGVPEVEECIPASVSALAEPAVFPFHRGLVTEVSTSSESAKIHTQQGLNHLHGGWEFEASRHFAAAMREDPKCLIAHWGMVMCLLSPSPETDGNRIATTQRMLKLIADGEGTELERGYAYGLVKYIDEGPQGATQAFRKVSQRFPGEIQAEIFAALFSRGGYDETGSITPDQKLAEDSISAMIEEHPDSAVPIHALLLIRAEAPDLRPSLELARRLCQLVPDYPPYFHLLGHYEWRCGEHAKAASAFGRAASLYALWMKQFQVPPADADSWVRAECYRVVALSSKGDFENAYASAEKIAHTSVDPKRPFAAGTRQLLWDAKTLPARVLLRRGKPGDSALALKSLPSPEEGKPFLNQSLSYWWMDGLRIALEAQQLMERGDLKLAGETISALSFHGEAMSKKQTAAVAVGEISEWVRSFRALEVLASELRGSYAMSGPAAGHGSAFNWFRAAADRQKPSTMLNTPPLLTPMAMRLGDYFQARLMQKKAIEAYEEALKSFPNDSETLERIKSARTMKKVLIAPAVSDPSMPQPE